MAEGTNLLVQQIKDVTVVTFQDARILDSAQIDRIGEALYPLVDTSNRRKLILDFSDVRFLSSAMLGVLITLQTKCEGIQGRLVLCGLRPELFKVFKLSKLDRLLTIADNEARALAAFGITIADGPLGARHKRHVP